MLHVLLNYWWIPVLILTIVLYKTILRVFFGLVIVPEDKIGLVTKKFTLTGEGLKSGQIIATNGEAGFQVDTLSPGLRWFKWVWQYNIQLQPFIVIPKGKIGLVSAKDGASLKNGQILARSVECNNYTDARAFLTNGGAKGKQTRYITTGTYRINTLLFEVMVADITNIDEGKMGIITALDGEPLNKGSIAGTPVEGHNNFQDFDTFLEKGGQRGLQTQFILAGSYSLNPWAVEIQIADMTEVPIGNVGVIISFVGEEGQDVTGKDFKHGNIVKAGQKGVQEIPLDPGKYPINPQTTKLQIVPTTNIVLNWATARTEAHQLDKNLSTITVRSKDGFPFNLDVSQIIHIPAPEAPKVIARFGSVQNLVSQVLEPTIGNYFRNSAQNSDVIEFLDARSKRQEEAKQRISEVLTEYNVHAVDTLIGDITPPAELMKPLTDRKIASEQQKTFNVQMEAQKVNQTLQKETALAEIQPKVVASERGVEIADNEAKSAVKKAEGAAQAVKLNADARAYDTTKNGEAEASKVLAIGSATAQAYQKGVDAMGKENFGRLKVMEVVGHEGVELIPKVLINGASGGGSIEGLLGMQLLKQIVPMEQDNEKPRILGESEKKS